MFQNKEQEDRYIAMKIGPTFIQFSDQPFTPKEARRQYDLWLTQLFPYGYSGDGPDMNKMRVDPRVRVIDIKEGELV